MGMGMRLRVGYAGKPVSVCKKHSMLFHALMDGCGRGLPGCADMRGDRLFLNRRESHQMDNGSHGRLEPQSQKCECRLPIARREYSTVLNAFVIVDIPYDH